jgi:hypothetical protein
MFVKNRINDFLSKLSLGLLILIPASSYAMSLSTYRIYLDSDNSTASFVMFNKKIVAETCTLSLAHNSFSETGQLSQVDDNILPENSAKPWIRFSPKNFKADGRSPQTVRFTLRRKSNSQPAEYRSYLEVLCDEVKDTTQGSKNTLDLPTVSIKPRLVQQIPIIVRTGKLNAEISFSDMSVKNNTVHFTINREGNRSIHGDVELIDKESGDIISYSRNSSLYTETSSKRGDLITKGYDIKKLAIRFVEDKRYGGSITHQQDIITN